MKFLMKFDTKDDVVTRVLPNVCYASATKSVLFNVEPLRGVFIQHIDGRLFTVDDWQNSGYSNELANGVAVVDDACDFVISKEQASAIWSSNTSSLVSGIITSNDSKIAKTDYSGRFNTENISKDSTNGAAYMCIHYTFPNGEKGYLPALGEWFVVEKYRSAIQEAMSMIGGTTITFQSTYYYWSSTQYDNKRAWAVYWPYNSATPSWLSKSSNCGVRIFGSLPSKLKVAKIIAFTIKGEEFKAENGMTWEQWVNSPYSQDKYEIYYDSVRLKSNTTAKISTDTNGYLTKTSKIVGGKAYVYYYSIDIEA